MPGLPPPLLPEADRGYKRAGRAPAAAPLCACAHAAARGAQRGAQGGGGEGEEEEVEEGGRQRGARCGQPQCVDYPLLHYAGATVQLKGDCTRPAGLDCSAAVPYEEGTSECGRGAAGGCRGRYLPACLMAEAQGQLPGREGLPRSWQGPGGCWLARWGGGRWLPSGARPLARQVRGAAGGNRHRPGAVWKLGGEEFSKGKQNKIYRQVLFSAPAAHGKVPASGPDRLPSRKKPRKALGKKIAVINQLPVLTLLSVGYTNGVQKHEIEAAVLWLLFSVAPFKPLRRAAPGRCCS